MRTVSEQHTEAFTAGLPAIIEQAAAAGATPDDFARTLNRAARLSRTTTARADTNNNAATLRFARGPRSATACSASPTRPWKTGTATCQPPRHHGTPTVAATMTMTMTMTSGRRCMPVGRHDSDVPRSSLSSTPDNKPSKPTMAQSWSIGGSRSNSRRGARRAVSARRHPTRHRRQRRRSA